MIAAIQSLLDYLSFTPRSSDMRWDSPLAHVRAWYFYASAAEVYSACALAVFLPMTLERIARQSGYLAPELTTLCSVAAENGIKGVCKVQVLGVWVDTVSFSMYTKSIAVGMQALCIVTIGPLADEGYWRKRILVACALIGATSAILYMPLPLSPIVAAVLTIIGHTMYATSIVCANAFLPLLAREDPHVAAAARKIHPGNGHDHAEMDETDQLLPPTLQPAIRATSTQDLVEGQEPVVHHASLLSLTISRISSLGIGLGLLAGMSVNAMLTVPVTIMKGSLFSLRLAIGVSGIWWAILTIPAWVALPGGVRDPVSPGWLLRGWKRVGRMVRPSEIRSLSNLFTFLIAWTFLADGLHTSQYATILFCVSVLKMSPSKIILIGIIVQAFGTMSSILAPRFQRRMGYNNQKLLLYIILATQVIPIYVCAGFVVPYGGLKAEWEMYVLAVYFGILLGPFNSYARAVYAELIPVGHESTFFSLFSLTDKSSSFFGPIVVGILADLTGNLRTGYIFVLVMLAIPVPVLLTISMEHGREEAKVWLAAKAREDPEEHRRLLANAG